MIYKEPSEFKNIYIRVQRNMLDTNFAYRLYGLLTLLSLVIFGYFGIRVLINQISAKKELITEITELNTNLSANIAELTRVKNEVLSNEDYIASMETYMPSEYRLEEYVVSLSDAISKSGFIMKNVSTSISSFADSETIVVNIKMDGPGNPVDLARNIESLKRISTLEDLSYRLNTHSSVKLDSDATVVLNIYKVGGRTEIVQTEE